MSLLSIKIKIGDREYPMKVASEEEAQLRLAGKILSEKLKEFQRNFGIDDKQDLLAMVAFDTMVANIKAENASSHDTEQVTKKIHELGELISRAT